MGACIALRGSPGCRRGSDCRSLVSLFPTHVDRTFVDTTTSGPANPTHHALRFDSLISNRARSPGSPHSPRSTPTKFRPGSREFRHAHRTLAQRHSSRPSPSSSLSGTPTRPTALPAANCPALLLAAFSANPHPPTRCPLRSPTAAQPPARPSLNCPTGQQPGSPAPTSTGISSRPELHSQPEQPLAHLAACGKELPASRPAPVFWPLCAQPAELRPSFWLHSTQKTTGAIARSAVYQFVTSASVSKRRVYVSTCAESRVRTQ